MVRKLFGAPRSEAPFDMTRVTILGTAIAMPAGPRAQRDMLERHREIVSEQLWTQRGLQVGARGDGLLAIFPEAQSAVRCAVGVLRSGDAPVGIGIHTGAALWMDGAVSGAPVIEALRLTGLAACGEILVSSDVVARAREFSFAEVSGAHRVLWGDER